MADEQQTTDAAAEQKDAQQQPPAEDGLGDAGKKALEAERATVRELQSKLAKLEAEQEKARKASMTEQERAVEEAKAAGRAEALAEVKTDLARSRVTAAAAAAGFADPGDAHGFLDLAGLDDDKAVKEAVAALAKSKPYLLKRTTTSIEQGPKGKGDQGTASDWLRQALGAR